MKPNGGERHEILIIRRGGGDDNVAPKGGAWKIAYADFVTALMAFFLVMWLINAANEVTKARVASYFNPIKMTDASPARRGLKEEIDAQSPNNRGEEQKSGGGEATEEHENGKPVRTLSVSDDVLLMNPYAMLDELVRQSQKESNKGAGTEEVAAMGDPFNPRSFEHLPEPQADPATAKEETVGAGGKPAHEFAAKPDESHATKSAQHVTPNDEAPLPPAVKPATTSAEAAPNAAKMQPAEGNAESKVATGPMEKDVKVKDASEPAAAPPATPDELPLVQELREQIEMLIDKFRGSIDVVAKVKMTNDGLLVVLEDGRGRSMFSNGSAQPNPALVEIIGNIGKILTKAEGSIVIRGHTDGRQFRNRKYDNWQLSTDRAHMASYMLVRGGLAETRVKRIEGYGSSTPVVPNEPMLDANRRVEFLVVK